MYLKIIRYNQKHFYHLKENSAFDKNSFNSIPLMKQKLYFISNIPLGPFTSLISTIFSVTGFLLLTYNRTIDPASFKASTALLCVTSRTSTSFTRRIQSLTLETVRVMLSCCFTAQCTH